METRNNIEIKSHKAEHPGTLVVHWLEEEGIKKKYLADKMGIPQSRLSEFLNGKRNLTEDMASKLAEHLGMSADYWMSLQIQYEYDERMFALHGSDGVITQARLSSSVKTDSAREYSFNMNLYVFEDKGKRIAHSPSLNLSSSGDSFSEAIANLYHAFQLYIEENIQAGTLEKELLSHGWKIHSETLEPPTDDIIRNDPQLRKLMRNHIPFKIYNFPMSFAV